MNRCLARLDEESSRGPDRFLPSAIMLDPPGQHQKLPDGPSVQPRCASEHCLGNREILEGLSKFVYATFHDFSGVVNLTNCDRTPPYFEINFTNMEKSSSIIMRPFFAYRGKKPLHTGVRTGCHSLVCLSVCLSVCLVCVCLPACLCKYV